MEYVSAIGFGMITIGSSDYNLTIAGGLGEFNSEITPISVFAISGTTRINNRLAITTENFIIPNQNTLINYIGVQSLRVLTKKNAFDFGLFILGSPTSTEKPFFGPIIGYTRTFEFKK